MQIISKMNWWLRVDSRRLVDQCWCCVTRKAKQKRFELTQPPSLMVGEGISYYGVFGLDGGVPVRSHWEEALRDTQDILEWPCHSVNMGTPWGPPGRAGVSVQRQGSLDVHAETTATTTQCHISGRMDGWRLTWSHDLSNIIHPEAFPGQPSK